MMPNVMHCWLDGDGDEAVVMQRGTDDTAQGVMFADDFEALFGFLPSPGKQVAIPFGAAGKPTTLDDDQEALGGSVMGRPNAVDDS